MFKRSKKLDARKVDPKTKKAANKFYIYMYLDLNNIPFYVGKGKGYRCYVSEHLQKSRSNSFLKNKIRKVSVDNIKIKFLHKNLAEKEAFKREKYWIKYYGRRDLKKGTLCNLTNGASLKGRTLSAKTKQKMSKAKKGRKLSDKHRQAISTSKKGQFTGENYKKTFFVE